MAVCLCVCRLPLLLSSLSLVHHNLVNKISCVMYVSVLAHWSLFYSNRNRGRRRILQSHATCPSTSPCLVVCFCDAFLLHNRADQFVLELIRLFCSLLLLLDCIHLLGPDKTSARCDTPSQDAYAAILNF